MNAALLSSANDLHGQLTERFNGIPHKTGQSDDPMVVAKLFDMAGSATWWITEYDSKRRVAWCYVTGLIANEWGTVSIEELSELIWNGVPRIEVDLHFKPVPFSRIDQETGRLKGVSEESETSGAGADGEVIPLSAFIDEFGASLLDAVREQNPPVYRGETNLAREAVMDGLLRNPFPIVDPGFQTAV